MKPTIPVVIQPFIGHDSTTVRRGFTIDASVKPDLDFAWALTQNIKAEAERMEKQKGSDES